MGGGAHVLTLFHVLAAASWISMEGGGAALGPWNFSPAYDYRSAAEYLGFMRDEYTEFAYCSYRNK